MDMLRTQAIDITVLMGVRLFVRGREEKLSFHKISPITSNSNTQNLYKKASSRVPTRDRNHTSYLTESI